MSKPEPQVLFLDDDPFRHIAFAKTRSVPVLQTSSVVTAWRALRGTLPGCGTIREAWLDHDLQWVLDGQDGFTDGGNKIKMSTVEPLIDWLCSSHCKVSKALALRIHSTNEKASASVAEKLKRAGYTNVQRPDVFKPPQGNS